MRLYDTENNMNLNPVDEGNIGMTSAHYIIMIHYTFWQYHNVEATKLVYADFLYFVQILTNVHYMTKDQGPDLMWIYY